MGIVIQFPVRQMRRSLSELAPVPNDSCPDYSFILDVSTAVWIVENLNCDAASAYVSMSRGCTAAQRATLWGATAIERRTGLSIEEARAAVADLIRAGVVARDRFGTRPAYRLLPISQAELRTYVHDFSLSGGAFVEALETARKAEDRNQMARLIKTHGQDIRLRRQG